MPAKKPQSASYQEMLRQLDDLLAWFQADDVDLDEAIGKYEQGMDLVAQLELHLKKSENKIEKIKQRFDGSDA